MYLTFTSMSPTTTTRNERMCTTYMGTLITYRPSAERAYRHTPFEDVAKRVVRRRRRLFRR